MFNNVNAIATTFLNNYFRGIDSSDYVEAFRTVSLEEVETIINEHFNFDNLAVSVVEK